MTDFDPISVVNLNLIKTQKQLEIANSGIDNLLLCLNCLENRIFYLENRVNKLEGKENKPKFIIKSLFK